MGVNRLRAVAVITAAALTLTGCESWSRTQKGGAIGAGVGAGVGVLIGRSAKGAIIGAAVGGAAGALIGRHMDKQAEELARDIPGARVDRVGEGIAVSFESGILFPFDSAELQSNGRDNLRKLANSLQENARTEVMIVGHTDSVGAGDYNQGLSERRARAASDYLVRESVAQGRLRPSGKGESEPIASNDSEDGRQQNRRVEIAIFANSEWREEAKREAAAPKSMW